MLRKEKKYISREEGMVIYVSFRIYALQCSFEGRKEGGVSFVFFSFRLWTPISFSVSRARAVRKSARCTSQSIKLQLTASQLVSQSIELKRTFFLSYHTSLPLSFFHIDMI